MTISIEDAKTILDMFGYVHGEGGLSDEAYELVVTILENFPALRDAKGNDGLSEYGYLLT